MFLISILIIGTHDPRVISPNPVRYQSVNVFREKNRGKVDPAGIEPATWWITAYNQPGDYLVQIIER